MHNPNSTHILNSSTKQQLKANMSCLNYNSLALIMTTLLIILFLVSSNMAASDDPSTKISPETACSYTPDPDFCKSFFSTQAAAAQNLYSYSTFSLSSSLSDSTKFLNSINQHLSTSTSSSAVMALQDCQLLFDLNIDFLSSATSTLTSAASSAQLADSQAEALQALLDAVLTNQQTCLQSLQEASTLQNDLSISLANGTKLSGVSLALFKHAWTNPNKKPSTNNGSKGPSSIPKKPKQNNNNKPGNGRKLMLFHEAEMGPNGELPLKMSKKNHLDAFEKRTARKLLQSSSGSVLVTKMVVVSQDGTGDFKTITEAVNKAPNNTNGANGYHMIFVSAGVYKEYVSIAKNKKYLMMVGDGINQTVVTGDHNNIDGWTTFNSATFAVVGQGFVAINMTFRNTAGPAKHQAVALRSGADLSTFHSCSFEGYQDTLYPHSLRQFYRDCDIYGTVDFIFGNAAVVLQNCNIYPRLPMKGQSNTITAQGRTDPNQNTGISIHKCTIAPAENLGSTKTYLGRPWKEYSRTVIMKSILGSLIDPAGWMPWSGTFALSTLYYAEYINTGAGSGTTGRVTWPGYHKSIATNDALNFTVSNLISGDNWIPQTGVPYSSGL